MNTKMALEFLDLMNKYSTLDDKSVKSIIDEMDNLRFLKDMINRRLDDLGLYLTIEETKSQIEILE